MNATADLLMENQRIDPRLKTMDAAAEALQSLGEKTQPTDKTTKTESEASTPGTGTDVPVDKKQEEEEEVDPLEKPEISIKQEEEEPSKEETKDKGEDTGKRYLPEHKKPDAAPTFPEKLMKLMRYAETQEGEDNNFCVAWLEDGKSFVIRKPDEFTRTVVPKFFKPTKFSSFTRKLYRWGFRQVNRGIGPDDPIIFGNEHFLRDDAERMSKMRSVTAAATRKEEQKNHPPNHHPAAGSFMYGAMGMMGAGGGKHPLEAGGFDENAHKRLMLEHMYHHKAGMMGQAGPGGGGPPGARMPAGGGGPGGTGPPGGAGGFFPPGMNPNGPMGMGGPMRPGMGMPPPHHHGHMMQPTGPPGMNPGGYDYGMGYGPYNTSHTHSQYQHPGAANTSAPAAGGGQQTSAPSNSGGAPGVPGAPQQQQPQMPHMHAPYNMPYHHHPPPHGQYPPHQPHPSQQQQQSGQPMQHPPHGPPNQPSSQYPNPAATAEIVNAAIAALRHAN